MHFKLQVFIIIESESVGRSVASVSAIPQTVFHQAPLFMEFPRQEYWSALPFPSPLDLPDPGIKHGSSASQADSLLSDVYLYKISNSFFVTVELEFLVKWILVSEGVED